MGKDYGKIIYRKETGAYVVGKLCVPHPEDTRVPDEIHKDFLGLWEDVNAYAEAHPEMVTEEEPYSRTVPTTEELASCIRAERDRRLAMTDHLVMPDYQLDADKLKEIKVYRQALRDLPQQEGFPWEGPNAPACPWPVEAIVK